MATYEDITTELIEQIAAHHDAHPDDYRDFPGQHGLVLTTSAHVGEIRKINYRFDRRIGLAISSLRNYDSAFLLIGDGTRAIKISVKSR